MSAAEHVAYATGATIAGLLLGLTARHWAPQLERLESRATQALERRHKRATLNYYRKV